MTRSQEALSFFLQCRCGFFKQYSGMKKTGGYKILVKAAVRKFCLFVAIFVWKPGIAAACGIIFLAWAVSMCVSQSGVCVCQSVTAPVWMFTVLRNHRLYPTLNLTDTVKKCIHEIKTHLLKPPCHSSFIIQGSELFFGVSLLVSRNSYQSTSHCKCYVPVPGELLSKFTML